MVRIAKIALTAAAGILVLLVGVDNVFDYQTNFEGVKHILSMDAVPPGPLSWRAIANPVLHHLCYAFIIATELGAGAVTLYGAFRLWRARRRGASTFNAEKGYAVAGLAAALCLYLFGFLAIGGEWFEMWRAGGWNMQEPAYRFVGSVGLVMLFLAQREE